MKKEWYECRIKYRKELEDGKKKKVTETYIVSAISVSDAEKIMIGEMSTVIEGEFAVTSVKEANFSEIFRNEEEHFYQCKVSFIVFDDDNGDEKKSNSLILVQADDFDSARKNLQNEMKNTLSDYTIVSIAETSIINVIS